MGLSPFFRRRTVRSLLRGALRYVFGKRGQRRVHSWRLFYRIRSQVLLRSFPSVHGIAQMHEVRVWMDRQVFPRIEKLLLRAHHTVVIQMFIWKDDELGRRIAHVLLRIADRGVKVEIWKDAVGDVFEFHRDFLTTRRETHGIWQRFWSHPNIRVSYDTHDDHAKVFIIDDKTLLLTGMNIANEYHEELHDYMVELRGSRFVEHYLTGTDGRSKMAKVRLVMNTDVRKEVRPMVMHLIASAQKSIVIEHCYVSDKLALDALIARSKQGIRVTIIIPATVDIHHYNNMQSIARLISEGSRETLRVFMYPKMFHGKIMLIDRARAFLGSANLIKSSLDNMGEVNVLLEEGNDQILSKLRDILREDILRSQLLNTPPALGWIGRWLTLLNL